MANSHTGSDGVEETVAEIAKAVNMDLGTSPVMRIPQSTLLPPESMRYSSTPSTATAAIAASRLLGATPTPVAMIPSRMADL